MKMNAAVLWEVDGDWSIEEVDLDPPQQSEVLVSFEATGLVHSDHHARTDDISSPLPMIGGHEGAGIVQEVGLGVTGLNPATTWWRLSCQRAGGAVGVRRVTRTFAI